MSAISSGIKAPLCIDRWNLRLHHLRHETGEVPRRFRHAGRTGRRPEANHTKIEKKTKTKLFKNSDSLLFFEVKVIRVKA